MDGSIDDFSLLVNLRSPDDLAQRPRYQSSLDPKQSKLVEVLAPYHFEEPYPCGLSSCHTPHQTGYLVVTDDNRETNIGGVCGKRIFGDDFVIKANLQDQRARLKHQLDTLQAICDDKDQFFARIAELYNRSTGTRWAETQLKLLKESLSSPAAAKLHAMAARGETAVTTEREATKEERDQHSVTNTSAKPLRYVTETVGDLQGLSFLNANPHRAATDLKNKLFELGNVDAKSLSPKHRRDWVNWANDIERSFDAIEESLAEALRFFSRDNMLLVHKLDIIGTQGSR